MKSNTCKRRAAIGNGKHDCNTKMDEGILGEVKERKQLADKHPYAKQIKEICSIQSHILHRSDCNGHEYLGLNCNPTHLIQFCADMHQVNQTLTRCW